MRRKAPATQLRAKRTRIEKKLNRRDTPKNPAIVEVESRDELSLFRAVCIGMYYYKKGGGEWRAVEIYERSNSLSSEAIDLWTLVVSPSLQQSYGLEEVKKVYKYLDTTHPEMYRILVFTDTSGTRPVYNSGNNARHNICLYYSDGHFDLIKTPQKLFRKRHYCVDCEISYEDLKNHSDCKIRCRQCFRSGYGYPCTGDMDLECPDCHKLFPNQDCLDAHKPYSCNTYRRCIYCDVQYRVRPERPGRGHRCDKNVPRTASIATEPLTVPKAPEQDASNCAKAASNRPAGGVQQSIMSWLLKLD